MNSKSTILLAAAFIAVAAVSVRSQQESAWASRARELSGKATIQVQVQHGANVVTLVGEQIGGYGSTNKPDFIVAASTSSSNAMQFSYGDNLAQSLADLAADGYDITIHNWGWLTYTAIKKF